MTAARVEPGFDQDRNFADRDAAHGLAPDLSRVLVVGSSQINRIVVARIVERSGLKPISETPVGAVRILPLMFPGLVILDGGPDNKDCDSVAPGLMALRRVSDRKLPAVILLSNRTGDDASIALGGSVDAVVTKPFTTEQLQPVVDRLVGKARK
ncbi:response regulator [Mesorhizobium sp. KR9-304]|uniref:response regulator n=1 Tax=Mesorhizobium sp. KR9-304 TaxID=3156614 RepID=UPI0032B43243